MSDLPDREAFERRWRAIKARSRAEVGPSLADRFRRLPRADRERILAGLSPLDCLRLLHDWKFWARPKQLPPPGDWDVWLQLGARACGKSRAAAEFVDAKVRSGAWRTFVLVGPDYQHVSKYMVGGEKGPQRNGGGLADIARPWCMPELVQSRLEVRYPNGAVGHIVTADRPEFRGANLDGGWCDEPQKWRYPDKFIQNLELSAREVGLSGSRPQIVYTANPARLGFLMRMIMDEGVHVTHLAMRENETNLPSAFIRRQEKKLDGTEDGARELHGDIDFFGDDERKIFNVSLIEATRVEVAPELERIAVSVDPGTTTNEWSDPTGIVAGGLDANEDVFVLADETEDTDPEPGRTDGRRGPRRQPEDWARVVVDLCVRVGASLVVAEKNAGGDMVLATIRAEIDRRRRERKVVPDLELRAVHSQGDKPTRAKPVRVLYRDGRVHHVGTFGKLENEMTGWEPGQRSPNRLDALVTLVRELRPDISHGDAAPLARGEFAAVEEANREIQRSAARAAHRGRVDEAEDPPEYGGETTADGRGWL